MYLVFALVIVLLLIVPATASDFIISYWCGPRADLDPIARYAEVAECNFNYCLPPCSAVTPEQNKAILDACAKYGLKYIIGDSRIFADPGKPDFSEQIDSVVADYSSYPALGGYFITDEPNSAVFPRLAAINKYLLKKDPKRLPYINLFPNYASEAQLGNPTYDAHVDQFCKTVKPLILSYDHYISMLGDPENPPNIASYFQNLETVRAAGLKYDIPTCYIMLSLPHFSYRNPTEADLRWQIYNSLVYGVKAILYFTYWTPGDSLGPLIAILDQNGKRTAHYNQVRRINGELKILGPTLMKLTSTGVYHSGDVPAGCGAQKSGLPVRVSNDAPVVLGIFKHEDGSVWAMVSNRLMRKPAKVELTLGKSVKRLEEISAVSGVRLDHPPDASGVVSLELAPGEGKLFKLVRE